MKRKMEKSKRENNGSSIGSGESTDKEVSEPMASRKKDKSLYKCSHCFLTYATVGGIMKHLLAHQATQVKLPKTSGVPETKERKSKEKNLPTCKVIITRCGNLSSQCQPIPERPHQCQLCSKSFAQRGNLKRHIRTHTGERPHRCQLCSKSFGNQNVLEAHIRTHTGERPHLCQLCSKSFTQLGSLKSHIRTHTGERPHRCQQCSKSFTTQGKLKIHIRSHTGERPYRCQLCSKSFATLGNLKMHIRTHTGERPYHCQLCSKSFGQVGSLKRHIRTHSHK